MRGFSALEVLVLAVAIGWSVLVQGWLRVGGKEFGKSLRVSLQAVASTDFSPIPRRCVSSLTVQ